jgi:hypothetical protein
LLHLQDEIIMKQLQPVLCVPERATSFSETAIDFQRNTPRYIPQDRNL